MGKLRLMVRPLRYYANFEGQSSLKEFWLFVLLFMLLSIPALIGDALLGRGLPIHEPFSLGLSVVFWVPTWALYVRRLHSLGVSGWWLFTWLGFLFFALLANALFGQTGWGRYVTSAFTLAILANAIIVTTLIVAVPARILDD